MSINNSDFLAKVREIDAQHPIYRSGGDGSDGTCDCIGLVIGAIRRAGGKWTGTHGSNYAARYEVDKLRRVSSAAQLQAGDMVLKKREPGEIGYSLPTAYANHPDQRDYYHAGVVLSTDPLDICHCTSPTTKHDDALGKWAFAARLRRVDYTEGEENEMDVLYRAAVATASGALNIRDAAGTGGTVLTKAPKGATLDVLAEGAWPRVRYGGIEGYASGAYLRRIEEDGTGAARLVLTDSAGNVWMPVGGFTVSLGGAD